MGSSELDALISRIGLHDEELKTRTRYLDIQDADRALMNTHAAHLAASHAAVVENLYSHLQAFEPMARILQNPAALSRLKQRQGEYYQQLWEAPFDDQYLRDRLHIGLVHQKLGIGLKWYMGAYRLYLDEMLQALVPPSEGREVFRSLLKSVFFDMVLAADTYTAAQHSALEQSEARLARAMRGANDCIWDWDVQTDRFYVSSRWADMLGCAQELVGDTRASWLSRVHQDDLPGLHQAIQAHLQGDSASLHHQCRVRKQNGEYLWVLIRGVTDHGSGSPRMAGSLTDISGSKEAENRLLHAARHDPLTGLANRTHLDELLRQAMQRRDKPEGRMSALLIVDLDRFKLINDSLGHTAGDAVLVEVAQRLQRCQRTGDQLVRFGGDEFVALVNDLASLEDAQAIAQRMLDALHEPILLDGRALVVTASIGIAALDDEDDTHVLQAADLALYRAKSRGKAQFAIYSSDLPNAAERRLELENGLRQALALGQFEVFYQPICRIGSHSPQLSGVEALLRWNSEELLASPGESIPILEDSGLIVPVGEWVLREACRQTRAWQLDGNPALYCSVNLSTRQLHQLDFAARVRTILEETGLAPASLVLEITESLLMQDSVVTLDSLRELARLGVRLALDDFGTGYCALGYLSRFPLHILKVDRSFIDGAPWNPELATISRAIISLGNSLGLEVIAEGVEKPEHLAFLQHEHCTLAQGYLFSRPRPATELKRLLDGHETFEGYRPPTSPALNGHDRSLNTTRQGAVPSVSTIP